MVVPLIVDHLGLTDLYDIAGLESDIAGGEVVDRCSGFGTEIEQVKATTVGSQLDVVS